MCARQLHPITTDRIDPDAAKVVRRLTRYGYEAYLVGGCVRDLLLGRKPKDFDVATSATPQEIKQLFRNCRIIGRRFRLAHIFFGPNIIETATFRAPPLPLSDDDDGDRLIWQDNEFGTAEEDARRRDFTVNGLFYDVNSGKVIDWVEGMKDLRAGSVRTIGDADVRFQEDPVRIIRAVKFSARLAFTIDERTRAAAERHAMLIARCSVARVLEEIYKLLRGGHAKDAFRQLAELRALGVLFPEISALLGDSGPSLPALRAGSRQKQTSGRSGSEEGNKGSKARVLTNTSVSPVSPASLFDEEADTVIMSTEEQANPNAFANPGPPPLEAVATLPVALDERAIAEELLASLELDEIDQRREVVRQLWAHLEALDSWVERSDVPPYPPLLLGALLCPLVMHYLGPERRMGLVAKQVDAVVRAVGLRLQVSRRHRERLKQIIIAQRRLVQNRPRHSLVQREYFMQSLELLRLRARTCGLERCVEQWDELLEGGGANLAPHRRRRSRRPRRGRRAVTGPVQPSGEGASSLPGRTRSSRDPKQRGGNDAG